MEVEITETYDDMELNRRVNRGETLEVEVKRGKYLIENKVAKVIKVKKEVPIAENIIQSDTKEIKKINKKK